MTYIQPNKNNILLNIILVFSAALFAFGVLWLVVLYNSVENFNHRFTQMKAEYQTIQTQNVELKEKFFNLLTPEKLKNLASEKRLIQDKKPEYLELVLKPLFAAQ